MCRESLLGMFPAEMMVYNTDYYSSCTLSKAVMSPASLRFSLSVFPLSAANIVPGTSEPLHCFIPFEKSYVKKKRRLDRSLTTSRRSVGSITQIY